MSRVRGIRWVAWSALAGIVSALVFLAIAEVAALLVSRDASPILAVGSFVIDIVPQPLKEFAISTFGEWDKVALLAGLGLAVVIAAAVAGWLQLVRPPIGVVALVVAGALSTAAIVTRAGATPLSWIPPLAGTIAGCVALALLSRRLRAWRDASAAPSPTSASADDVSADDAAPAVPAPGNASAMNRRSFFLWSAIAGVGAVAVGVGARVVTAATSSVEAARRALRIPDPRTTVEIPDGAELDVEGITPLFTPNEDFYRVDTALTVPSIDPMSWRLSVKGMVDEPFDIGFQDLLDMGLDEYVITLTCVSNEVGGGLVGNAKWLGVPVRDLLAKAKPQSDADMVLSRSIDGFTASTPLGSLTDDGTDAILAVAMNGEPLPLEHGYPVRMIVPGLYGYVSATKWITELNVTTFAKDEAYWTPRGYSAEAPIKFSSRVDTPKAGKRVSAGTVPIAGVAWAQTVGIERVELSIDGGDWQAAKLSSPVNEDTWVQWVLEWDATPGSHNVVVRAVNRDGETQIEERAPIAPNGSSGWQRTLILVD